VSVVIPTFNKDKTIVEAITSVLQQTHFPTEIILVDDGSEDDSLLRLSQAGLLRHIKLIQQENQGPGPARNTGWQYSSSEWVAFLDADDLWDSCHLSTLCSLVNQWPESEWAATRPRFDHGGERRYPNGLKDALVGFVPKTNYVKDSPVSYFTLFRKQVAVPQTSSIMVRRTALRSVNGFHAALPYEDFPLWCSLALRGNLALSSKSTVVIRRTGSNASSLGRNMTSNLQCDDPFAWSYTPHYQVVHQALELGVSEGTIRLEAQKFLDSLLTRHWPTVLLHQSQIAARSAARLLRRKRGFQYFLFQVAARLPLRLARLSSYVANLLLTMSGLEQPVSPFVRRPNIRPR
jgi:glycosyltransferase involved in cell wall biosynthesis